MLPRAGVTAKKISQLALRQIERQACGGCAVVPRWHRAQYLTADLGAARFKQPAASGQQRTERHRRIAGGGAGNDSAAGAKQHRDRPQRLPRQRLISAPRTT